MALNIVWTPDPSDRERRLLKGEAVVLQDASAPPQIILPFPPILQGRVIQDIICFSDKHKFYVTR